MIPSYWLEYDTLDSINLKIANLNAKYVKDKAELRSRGGMTPEGLNQSLAILASHYDDDYDALMTEWQQIKYGN